MNSRPSTAAVALAVGLAGILVGLLASRWRPPPRRVRTVLGRAAVVPSGRFVRRGAWWLGRAASVVAAFVLWPPGLVLVVGWWWVAPRLRRWRVERRSRDAVARALPDVIDLMVLLVGSGHTVPLAVAALGRVAPAPLGPGFAEVDRRRDRGSRWPTPSSRCRSASARPCGR